MALKPVSDTPRNRETISAECPETMYACGDRHRTRHPGSAARPSPHAGQSKRNRLTEPWGRKVKRKIVLREM